MIKSISLTVRIDLSDLATLLPTIPPTTSLSVAISEILRARATAVRAGAPPVHPADAIHAIHALGYNHPRIAHVGHTGRPAPMRPDQPMRPDTSYILPAHQAHPTQTPEEALNGILDSLIGMPHEDADLFAGLEP